MIMRTLVLLLVLGTCLATATGAGAFSLWNDFRASALLPGETVTLRVENPQDPGLQQTVLYAQTGVQEAALTAVADGPSTLEATVPGPAVSRAAYGFRLVQGADIDLLPVGLPAGATPGRLDLSQLADDPVGDEIFGQPNLDLTECRIASDGVRLYASLSNAGGGFPVSAGLTFFSYLLGIAEPGVADPDTVFGIIHTVDVAGIIAPGLYQINGSGVDDLVKLGEITATELPGENTLVLSCLLADLEANALFQSWYDPADPRIDVAAFTQRISLLGGVGEADATTGGVWHLRPVFLEPETNTLPQLSALTVPAPGAGGFASVVYTDAEGNCPVTAEIVFDGLETYPLRPVTLAYGAPVEYRTAADIPPLGSAGWSSAVVRFSDNGVDVVEAAAAVSAVTGEELRWSFRAWPNPSSGRTDIAFELPRASRVQLAVYDLAGRRVAQLTASDLPAGAHRFHWDGRDAAGRFQATGVYFLRLVTGDRIMQRRVVLVR
jgi:hypothetical protein